jgi:predicted DNA-binding transcriptional regulator AlpA
VKVPASAGAPAAVPVVDRLRWSLAIVEAMVDLSANKIRELIRKGEFPSRIAVDGKEQFVPDEVRAWAAGRDWRNMVKARAAEASDAT